MTFSMLSPVPICPTIIPTVTREIALPIALDSEQEPGVLELSADAGVTLDCCLEP